MILGTGIQIREKKQIAGIIYLFLLLLDAGKYLAHWAYNGVECERLANILTSDLKAEMERITWLYTQNIFFLIFKLKVY